MPRSLFDVCEEKMKAAITLLAVATLLVFAHDAMARSSSSGSSSRPRIGHHSGVNGPSHAGWGGGGGYHH
jgi:hypothetical protein